MTVREAYDRNNRHPLATFGGRTVGFLYSDAL